MKHIHNYYSPNDLYNNIIEGLQKLGKDISKVTLDDLQPVDEFHIRGDAATKELIELSGFTSDMHILDVGCGIGGSTRRLSHQVGCRTTGIDLSDEYVDAAQRLTQLLDMHDRVAFHAASALDLPFDDNTFDGAWANRSCRYLAYTCWWETTSRPRPTTCIAISTKNVSA